MAANSEEAAEMVGAAENSKGLSMTVFNNRFQPAVKYARKLIDENFIGRVYRFFYSVSRVSHVYPKRYFSWKDKLKTSGGGCLLEMGIMEPTWQGF